MIASRTSFTDSLKWKSSFSMAELYTIFAPLPADRAAGAAGGSPREAGQPSQRCRQAPAVAERQGEPTSARRAL